MSLKFTNMTPHFDAKSKVAMLIVKSHVEYPIIFYIYRLSALRCSANFRSANLLTTKDKQLGETSV